MNGLVYITNSLSHHRLSMANSLYRELGKNFYYVETSEMAQERIKLGYEKYSTKYPYILNLEINPDIKKYVWELVRKADVIVSGGITPYIYPRLADGKLTFLSTERIFKKGFYRLANPRKALYVYRKYIKHRHNTNFHLLSASAYCPWDMQRIGMFKSRMWKWGYFPNMVNKKERIIKDGNVPILLWVGRMIDWKQPEHILYAANNLTKEGFVFCVKLIGMGDKKKKLEKLIKKLNLQHIVEILSQVKQNVVLEEMKKAHVYILPSNYQEGWGAVINEAMSAECCVVSSSGSGAAPYLIKNGITGFIYKGGDIGTLTDILKKLITEKGFRENMAQKGREYINSLWTGEVAAKRLIQLSRWLLGESDYPNFIEGPCSKAEILKNNGLK